MVRIKCNLSFSPKNRKAKPAGQKTKLQRNSGWSAEDNENQVSQNVYAVYTTEDKEFAQTEVCEAYRKVCSVLNKNRTVLIRFSLSVALKNRKVTVKLPVTPYNPCQPEITYTGIN